MNNIVYGILPNELFNAFQRYLKFIFEIKLNKNISVQFNKENKFYLFINEEELKDSDKLETFINLDNIKTVILGYNKNKQENYIDLLDLNHLNTNLLKIVNSKIIDNQEITAVSPKIHEKLVAFFKGHGEESLLSCLYASQYYLLNGPILFEKGNISFNEYFRAFLEPGFQNWELFLKRLKKYGNYLFVAGFEKELNNVILQKKKFNVFVSDLKKMNEKQLVDMDISKYVKKNIFYIKEIDKIFTKIQQELISEKNEV